MDADATYRMSGVEYSYDELIAALEAEAATRVQPLGLHCRFDARGHHRDGGWRRGMVPGTEHSAIPPLV